MIHDKSRAYWFGASDTSKIMGNWDTQTFRLWWLEKLGIRSNGFTTPAMAAGTAYEHRILDTIQIKHMDRQIRLRWLRLRVNLDGEDMSCIHEVKTFSGDRFKVSKAYWQQCQVEMFAAHKHCRIVAYKMVPEDYENYFHDIDPDRLSYWPIEYNAAWVQEEYLPRLKFLAWCLRRRLVPTKGGFEAWLNLSFFQRLLCRRSPG